MADAANFDAQMAAQAYDSDELCWTGLAQKKLEVRGLGFYQHENILLRLPRSLERTFQTERPAMVELSRHMAGVRLLFETDSSAIWLRMEMDSPAYMSHMTACGQCGADAYARPVGQSVWKLCGVTKFPLGASSLTCRIASGFSQLMEVCVELPLYIGVKAVEIGIPAGAKLWPVSSRSSKAIAFYGTSITQGGCASRPGMAYPAILGRELNVETYNLGFSGNGVGLTCIARALPQMPGLSALVVDMEPNAAPEGLLEANLPAFLDEVRKALPLLPILVLAGTRQIRQDFEPSFEAQRRKWSCFQRNEVDKRRAVGDQRVFFADPETFEGMNTTEITVDGVHLTDWGFALEAKALKPILSELLSLD